MAKSDKVGTLLIQNEDSVVIQEEGNTPIALGDLAKSYLKSNKKALTIGGRATYTLITTKDKPPIITYITMSFAKKAAPAPAAAEPAPEATPPAEKPAPKPEPKAEAKPKETTQKPVPAQKPAPDPKPQADTGTAKETMPTAAGSALSGIVELGITINIGNYSSFTLKVVGDSGEHARALLEQESEPTIRLVKSIARKAQGEE
jgi:hypothetical protein